MSRPNYGKKFEKIIEDSFCKVDGVDVQRLYDATSGFIGVRNPSDYIVYKYPYQYYIECKCTWDNTLHKDYISQLLDLYNKSKTKGIISGVIVWFISHDYTAFISSENLVRHFETHKSINIKDLIPDDGIPNLRHIPIIGYKKRIFFTYDMVKFFSCFNS